MTNRSGKGAGTAVRSSGSSGSSEVNEVERGRELGDWRRVLELLESEKDTRQKNSSKTQPASDPLLTFLQGEAKLEIWLEEHQPTEKFISKAKASLIDVKKSIVLSMTQSPDDIIAGLRTDAHVILAKIYFASGLYEEALEELEKSRFESISQLTKSVRNLQLMAEAFAIKGHSYEKVGRSWRGLKNSSDAERRAAALNCHQRSADLAIAFFQAQEKVILSLGGSGTSPLPSINFEKRRASSVLETSIRRVPAILLEDGKTTEAIKRIQWLLRTVETNAFYPTRLALSRFLAELLLRSIYVKPTPPTGDMLQKAKIHAGQSIYSPNNLWEDIFLALLLSETMVIRDGVLNQTPEFAKARRLANMNANSVFDLIGLAGGRWGNFKILNECIEKSLKFSYEEAHTWEQYALSLHASGHTTRKCVESLKEASRLSNRSTPLLLIAAQQEFMQLNIKEGLEFVREAKSIEEGGNGKLLSRVFLYEGIGSFLESFEQYMHQQRITSFKKSIEFLQKAEELDSEDYMTSHWMARVHAWMGNQNEALTWAVKSLQQFPFHVPTLQLVVLLLSGQKNYKDALALLTEALDEIPGHLGFLQIKAVLQEELYGTAECLGTLKEMLLIWKNHFEEAAGPRAESPDLRTPDNMSTRAGLQIPSPTDREGGSVYSFRAGSIAGSSTANTGTLTAGFRTDAALSEIASSLSIHGSLAHSGSSAGELAWTAQLNMWTMLAEVYIRLGELVQAAAAVEEAASIAPSSPDVLYIRGRVAEASGELEDARALYESAIALKPTHVKALQKVSLIHHQFGSDRLAEKMLQDALRLDPYDYLTWYNLGLVLESLEDVSEAADCFSTALEIEAIAPVLPFSTIPVTFE